MSQITFIYIYYINCDRSECLAIFVQTGKEVYESGKYFKYFKKSGKYFKKVVNTLKKRLFRQK